VAAGDAVVGMALHAFLNQTIASSMYDCDCSKHTVSIKQQNQPMTGSRGQRRMACSASGMTPSVDPAQSCTIRGQ
jgi:predicted SprT family Zn-dependent metalloprotease